MVNEKFKNNFRYRSLKINAFVKGGRKGGGGQKSRKYEALSDLAI